MHDEQSGGRNGQGSEVPESREDLLAHLDEFYEEWFRRIYAFVRRRVADRAEAEDLTQEVFVAALGSLASFEGRARVESWLFGVARNVVLAHVRRCARRSAWAQAAALATPPIDAPSTPEETLRGRRALDALRRELSAAGEESARAFHLRYVEQASLREVARRTAQSRHAVQAGLDRLRRRVVRDLRP